MSTTYPIPEPELTHELDGELVMRNLYSERYFWLDETGTRFWQALTGHNNLDAVTSQLVGEFDVSSEQIDIGLKDLIHELAEHGHLS